MKRSKYRAKPTFVGGMRFASKAEARRYGELKLLEKAGKIDSLRCQVPHDLCVGGADGYRRPIGKYIADFVYFDRTVKPWRNVVEDVKGFRTPLYRWKKKHFEAQYGIKIKEVR